MNEDAAASLALDAAQTLKGIGEDVAALKAQNSDVLASIDSLRLSNVEGFQQLIARDSYLPVPADVSDESANWVTEVRSEIEVPSSFFSDLMSFQYFQTVLLVFVLVSLLLNFGALLWLSFSDKWRV